MKIFKIMFKIFKIMFFNKKNKIFNVFFTTTESLKSSWPSHYRFGFGVGVDPRPSQIRSRSLKTLGAT